MLLTIVPPTAWGFDNEPAPAPSTGVEAREAAAALADEQGDPGDPDDPGFFGRIADWFRNLFVGSDDAVAGTEPAYMATEPADAEDTRGPPASEEEEYMTQSDAADASLEAYIKNIKPLGLVEIMPLVAGRTVNFHPNGGTQLPLQNRRPTIDNGTVGVGNMPVRPSMMGRAFLYWHTCPQGDFDCDGIDCYDAGNPAPVDGNGNLLPAIPPAPSLNCGVAGRFVGRLNATTVVNDPEITVYAQWGVLLEFQGNGAILNVPADPLDHDPSDPTDFSPRSVRTGFSVDEAYGMIWPENPTRPGFTFHGWYNVSQNSREPYPIGAVVGPDNTVVRMLFYDTPLYYSMIAHARWEFLGINLVRFNENGGAFDETRENWTPYRRTRESLGIHDSSTHPHLLNRFSPGNDWSAHYLPPRADGTAFPTTPNTMFIIDREALGPAMVSNTTVVGDRQFRGWSTTPEGLPGTEFTMDTVVENNTDAAPLQVYAQWNATVRFHPNTFTSWIVSQVPYQNSDLQNPNDVWQLGPRTLPAGATVNATPGIQWPTDNSIPTFGLVNGAPMTRTNFTFLGWYLPCPDRPAGITGQQAVPVENRGFTATLPYATRVTGATPIYHNVTLYARWARNNTLRQNPNGTGGAIATVGSASTRPPGASIYQMNRGNTLPAAPAVMGTQTYVPGNSNNRAGFIFRGWTYEPQPIRPLRPENPAWANYQPILFPVRNPGGYAGMQSHIVDAFHDGFATIGMTGTTHLPFPAASVPIYITNHTPLHPQTIQTTIPSTAVANVDMYAHWVRRDPITVTFAPAMPGRPNNGFTEHTNWHNERLVVPDTSLPTSTNAVTHFLNQAHEDGLPGGMWPSGWDPALRGTEMHNFNASPQVELRNNETIPVTFAGWWRDYEDGVGRLGLPFRTFGHTNARYARLYVATAANNADFTVYPSWVYRVHFHTTRGMPQGRNSVSYVGYSLIRDIREGAENPDGGDPTLRYHGMDATTNSASIPVTGITMAGDPVEPGLPSEPHRLGFEFLGWWNVNMEDNETPEEAAIRLGVEVYEFTSDTPVRGNRTVFARWSEVQLARVTFQAYNPILSRQPVWNACITPNNIYPHEGWNTLTRVRVTEVGVSINEAGGVTMPNGGTNTNGGSFPRRPAHRAGAAATAIHETGTGYVFGGWWTVQMWPGEEPQDAADRLQIPVADVWEFTGNTIVTGDITLYPRWTGFPITFNSNFQPPTGGTWAAQTAFGEPHIGFTGNVRAERVRVVRQNEYAAFFPAVTTNTGAVTWINNPAGMTANATGVGPVAYTWGGWWTENIPAGQNPTDPAMRPLLQNASGQVPRTMMTRDIMSGDYMNPYLRYYGRWLQHIVNFDAMGGEFPNGAAIHEQRVAGASTTVGATLMPQHPTRDGYVFVGWRRTPGGAEHFGHNTVFTTAANGTSQFLTANITVYAEWVPLRNLTIHGNSSTIWGRIPFNRQPANVFHVEEIGQTRVHPIGVGFTSLLMEGIRQDVQNPTAPVLTNHLNTRFILPLTHATVTNQEWDLHLRPFIPPIPYENPLTPSVFIGWNTDRWGRSYEFDNNTPVFAHMDIYAQWMYTVRFNSNHHPYLGAGSYDHHVEFQIANNHSILTSHTHPGTPETVQLAFPTISNWPLLYFSGAALAGFNTCRYVAVDGSCTECTNCEGTWFSETTLVNRPKEVYAIWSSYIVFNPGRAPMTAILPENRFRDVAFGGTPGDAWPPDPVWPAYDCDASCAVNCTIHRVPTFGGWYDRFGTQTGPGQVVGRGRTLYARWLVDVLFFGNNGELRSSTPPHAVLPDGTFGQLDAYDFLGRTAPDAYRGEWLHRGWRTHPTNMGAAFPLFDAHNTPIPRPMNLYAQWYSQLTFNLNGGVIGTWILPIVEEVRYNTQLPLVRRPGNPIRPGGYHFLGWFTNDGAGPEWDMETYVIVPRIQIRANYGLNITFNPNGGAFTELPSGAPHPTRAVFAPGHSGGPGDLRQAIHANNRDLVNTDLGHPTSPDGEFLGWYNTQASGTGTRVNNDTAFNTNLHTLWARWRAYYQTVTFNANGGVWQGGLTEHPTRRIPTLNQGGTYANAFNQFDNLVNETTLVENLPHPTNGTQTFLGWFTTPSGAGTRVLSTDDVSDDLVRTLYARWGTIDVLFNANGGQWPPGEGPIIGIFPNIFPSRRLASTSGTYSQVIEANGDLRNPFRLRPYHTGGYEFIGWFTEASGGTRVYDTTQVVSSSMHALHAQWRFTHQVVEFRVPPGSGATWPGSPTPPVTRTIQIDGSTGLYNQAFNEAGNLVDSITLLENQARPVHPQGDTFVGWFTAATGGEQVLFSDPVTRTQTRILYARFEPVTHQVTFNANGGYFTVNQNNVANNRITAVRTVRYGPGHTHLNTALTTANVVVALPTPPAHTDNSMRQGNPTRLDYTFAGWWTTPVDGGYQVVHTTPTVNYSRTLWARWTPNYQPGTRQVVTFIPGPDTSWGDNTHTRTIQNQAWHFYSQAFNAQDQLVNAAWAAPTRVGYDFLGWFDSPSGSPTVGRVLSTHNVTPDLTRNLYARFAPSIQGLWFVGNGGYPAEQVVAVRRDWAGNLRFGDMPTDPGFAQPVHPSGYTFLG